MEGKGKEQMNSNLGKSSELSELIFFLSYVTFDGALRIKYKRGSKNWQSKHKYKVYLLMLCKICWFPA